ncbi:hypothetical protein DL98DRAFT_281909 [Cadophora sp. DSE1049]|nr:hypothetical protein DL98DRAFT_281909 [Cadophora sp. DSE1049]
MLFTGPSRVRRARLAQHLVLILHLLSPVFDLKIAGRLLNWPDPVLRTIKSTPYIPGINKDLPLGPGNWLVLLVYACTVEPVEECYAAPPHQNWRLSPQVPGAKPGNTRAKELHPMSLELCCAVPPSARSSFNMNHGIWASQQGAGAPSNLSLAACALCSLPFPSLHDLTCE